MNKLFSPPRLGSSLLYTLFLVFLSHAPAFSAAGGEELDVQPDSADPCLPGQPCLLTPETPGAAIFRDRWKRTDDPKKDGWETEVFNNQADKQLKKIGKLILHPENISDQAHELIDQDFRAAPLRPSPLITVFKDKMFTVKRAHSPTVQESRQGIKGFTDIIENLAKPLLQAKDTRFKFKVYRVRKNEGYVVTHQYFALSGLTATGMLEQTATWRITWKEKGESLPVIVNIEVEEFEEVASHAPEGTLLRDATESILGAAKSYDQQLLQGYQEFLGSFENTLEFNIFGAAGIAVADVNNDGLDDIYICQEQGLPNLLYAQQQDGTAIDISAKSGVDWLESTRSALFLDLDNDKDQDLAVTMPGGLVISENDGHGNFIVKTVLAIGDDPMSLAGADYDLDGDVDLYVTLYNPNRLLEKSGGSAKEPVKKKFVYNDANNGPGNILFRNDIAMGQQWVFNDVTTGSGLDVNNSRFSLGAAWEDYDNDGDQDLYVANDYGRDNLYRNDTAKAGQARFIDVSVAAAIEDSVGSMSISWGDYNRDGNMDAFLSAMWSSAGNRVTFQDNFKNENQEVKARLQKFARGNTLLRNQGNSSFQDQTLEAGVAMGRWAWSSNFADLNNDGWEDIVIANGFLTGDEKGGDL